MAESSKKDSLSSIESAEPIWLDTIWSGMEKMDDLTEKALRLSGNSS